MVLGVLKGFGCTCWAWQMVLCVVAGAVVGFPMHWALAELARIKFRLLLWFSPPIRFHRECRGKQVYLNCHEIYEFINLEIYQLIYKNALEVLLER